MWLSRGFIFSYVVKNLSIFTRTYSCNGQKGKTIKGTKAKIHQVLLWQFFPLAKLKFYNVEYQYGWISTQKNKKKLIVEREIKEGILAFTIRLDIHLFCHKNWIYIIEIILSIARCHSCCLFYNNVFYIIHPIMLY